MAKFSDQISRIILIFLLLVVISGWINIAASLLLGMAYAVILGNPFQLKTQWASGILLKVSIVVMGFGLNIKEILETAVDGFFITVLTIIFAIVCGLLIGKLASVDKKLSFLITGGTAICGASAIAAFAPAIHARPTHILVSISIVFLLNALALLVYPELGKYLGLTQQEFGMWAALGIHDTSSVVGAAASYGEESLKIATTTKLARALWIIPLVFFAAFSFNYKKTSTQIPHFILYFVGASLLASFVPFLTPYASYAPLIAKKGMAISLFLIGTGFTRETLKTLQWSALLQGTILWILMSVISLWLIKLL
ncbi:YeiH family protein [Aliikangiella coralliicola]|uniref:Putative sulfate exporter family transporter n=1 Tax=Aliikangiella coralliicola TaxID=2592383 RepID=A0A545UDE0_9GAMM|nr:putative sulfate exporter family transporter [Aliikangiella coralliicola]TQV87478.1 putative sulfate exporter family transporter [Aliikangiella coralliicola]